MAHVPQCAGVHPVLGHGRLLGLRVRGARVCEELLDGALDGGARARVERVQVAEVADVAVAVHAPERRARREARLQRVEQWLRQRVVDQSQEDGLAGLHVGEEARLEEATRLCGGHHGGVVAQDVHGQLGRGREGGNVRSSTANLLHV